MAPEDTKDKGTTGEAGGTGDAGKVEEPGGTPKVDEQEVTDKAEEPGGTPKVDEEIEFDATVEEEVTDKTKEEKDPPFHKVATDYFEKPDEFFANLGELGPRETVLILIEKSHIPEDSRWGLSQTLLDVAIKATNDALQKQDKKLPLATKLVLLILTKWNTSRIINEMKDKKADDLGYQQLFLLENLGKCSLEQ